MEIKKLRKSYIFYDKQNGEEVFFCKCGKKFKESESVGKKDEITMRFKSSDVDLDNLVDEAVAGFNVTCPKCKENYLNENNYKIIKKVDEPFYSYFKFSINENIKKAKKDNRVYLYKSKINSKVNKKSRFVTFKEEFSYISFDTITKDLYYKKYDSRERSFNLDSLVDVVNDFYLSDTDGSLSAIDNIIDAHRFINELARHIVDSKNMDIVDGLMSQMIGKPGIDILMKITTIFLGIMCYSNLSTIALTKGTVFLYDMMNGCDLPNPKVLSDEGVTSPLKIFNFLVSLENKKTQDEINFDYKSKYHKFSSKVFIENGTIKVREDLKHKSVSKYIFNKIENFNDYKNLIKFTKFITYEELVSMVMKYDIQYIIELFNLIEFRADINKESLKQFINLTQDFINKKPNEKEDFKINYKNLNYFNFNNYDDSVRMIKSLNWDINKEFIKIKTVAELSEYHDKLVEHYNMLSDKEKYEKFKKIAQKYLYLEDISDLKDFNHNIKIKVLSNPKLVLEASKEMKNCAGSYVNRISEEKYLLCMLYDNRKENDGDKKLMLGFNVSNYGLELEQMKGPCNRRASSSQIDIAIDYLKGKEIAFKEIRDLRKGVEAIDFGFI
jgi:hypothetical protein